MPDKTITLLFHRLLTKEYWNNLCTTTWIKPGKFNPKKEKLLFYLYLTILGAKKKLD